MVNAAKASNRRPDAIVGGLDSNTAAGSSAVEVKKSIETISMPCQSQPGLISDEGTAISELAANSTSQGTLSAVDVARLKTDRNMARPSTRYQAVSVIVPQLVPQPD